MMPSIVLLFFAIGCVVEAAEEVIFDMNVDLTYNVWPTKIELVLEDLGFILISFVAAFMWPITMYQILKWRTKYKKESES